MSDVEGEHGRALFYAFEVAGPGLELIRARLGQNGEPRAPELARESHGIHRAAVKLGANQHHGAGLLGLKAIAFDQRFLGNRRSGREKRRDGAARVNNRVFELGKLRRDGPAEAVTDERYRRCSCSESTAVCRNVDPRREAGDDRLVQPRGKLVCKEPQRRVAACGSRRLQSRRAASCRERAEPARLYDEGSSTYVRSSAATSWQPSNRSVRTTSLRSISIARATPGAAGGAESVGVGAPDEHGARTQTERFDDVAAAADSAVQKDLRASADGVDDLGQCAQRRSDRVELPAAVIGDDDGIGAGVNGAARVLRGQNAFDDDRAVPRFA